MADKKLTYRAINTRLNDPTRMLIPLNYKEENGEMHYGNENKFNVLESTNEYSLIHYSHSKRDSLDPMKHGTGIKDGADKRLVMDGLDKSDLKNRVYFYLKTGDKLPTKEVGIGSHAHEVHADSLHLYDPATASKEENERLATERSVVKNRMGISDGSSHEMAVKNLGYDGYINRDYNFAVAIRNQPIPVDKYHEPMPQ